MMNYKSGASRKWFVGVILLVALVVLSLSDSAQSYVPPLPQDEELFVTLSLPKEALSSHALPAEISGADRDPKLDSVLVELASAAQVSRESADDLAHVRNIRLVDDQVHVQIITGEAVLPRALARIRAAGGEVTGVSDDSTLIQGWLPLSALEPVSSDLSIYRIQQPLEPVLLEDLDAGSYITEGLTAINGPAWHSAGYTGAGVKVGIIDGGFLGYPGLLGSELPASVVVKNFVDGETDPQVNGDTEHGTACAEIVHDIVPDASLYLAKISTNLDLQEAVTWLKDTIGVDIISTSLGWYNLTPGDGTGEFQDLVQSARDAGILWTTAAGNDREAHWGGTFSDPDANNYHNFNGEQEINYFGPGDGSTFPVPSGYTIRVALRWDDWTDVDQDYDLYLYRYLPDDPDEIYWYQVASSIDSQTGLPWQTPTEYLEYVTSDADSVYGFAIQRYSGDRNVNLEVFAPKIYRLDEVVHDRSLSNLADAPAAVTVAALDVSSPYSQEYYSSEGPTNGLGGTAAGGVNKPDISGFANISTESYGVGGFSETSSATPHVAGAAALVLSAYPTYTPDQLQDYLQMNAVDMGDEGMDTVYGWGRLYLDAPPVNDTASVFLPLIMKNFPAIPSTPILNAISNPDNNGAYTVSWSGAENATYYTLQEDDNPSFSNPTVIFNGPMLSYDVSGRGLGTYYYRVKAVNAYSESGWSNTQQVSVSEVSSECPQAGFWRGTTSQDERVTFTVENSTQCQIKADSLSFGWSTACHSATTSFYGAFEIINGQFNASYISDKLDILTGTFTASNMAEGMFEVEYTIITPYPRTCSASGIWDAQPLHGVDGYVKSIHVNSDGKIILGGNFNFVNEYLRHNIARLNSDGSLDSSFSPDFDSEVYSIVEQTDGKYLVGGAFAMVNGISRPGIARLNADGSLDSSFNPAMDRTDSDLNPRVHTIVLLDNGQMFIGGEFNSIDGQQRNYAARLNQDGSLDDSFNSDLMMFESMYDYVNAISIYDDWVFIGGSFTTAGDPTHKNLIRVSYSDGLVDETFTAPYDIKYASDVFQTYVQPGGKIIVAYNDGVVRLNTDGTVDSGFNGLTLESGYPYVMANQSDGKILIGGSFNAAVVQLESNGMPIPSFSPIFNNLAYAITVQPDGKILVGGDFTRVDGQVRHGVVRLNSDGTVDTSFDPGP